MLRHVVPVGFQAACHTPPSPLSSALDHHATSSKLYTPDLSSQRPDYLFVEFGSPSPTRCDNAILVNEFLLTVPMLAWHRAVMGTPTACALEWSSLKPASMQWAFEVPNLRPDPAYRQSLV